MKRYKNLREDSKSRVTRTRVTWTERSILIERVPACKPSSLSNRRAKITAAAVAPPLHGSSQSCSLIPLSLQQIPLQRVTFSFFFFSRLIQLFLFFFFRHAVLQTHVNWNWSIGLHARTTKHTNTIQHKHKVAGELTNLCLGSLPFGKDGFSCRGVVP